ncbi:MAG: S-methyl-5-thioribose-1-phosphate isomerase [Halobacteriovoraceae bacterium]|nr:S-methyl-5-thioribose-1-phosphate isomerase [Halobacteriovoraceae bacterium]|tara:strand:+ start:11531 stop:12583 length:1053 start_codon:yes stop_codon:yes gene_type:complete
MKKTAPLIWENKIMKLIDQRKLPREVIYHDIKTLEETHAAIKDMIVRGAPLIGFTALFGMVLWSRSQKTLNISEVLKAADYLKTARPTAVNLAYEVDRVVSVIKELIELDMGKQEVDQKIEDFSLDQMKLLHEHNLSMAKTAAKELEEKYGTRKLNIMTLCNTGYLACGPMGTALGVIEYLHSQNRIEHVYASETRPYLQGGRLTAYELATGEIPHSITVEGAFSYLLKNKSVDAIFIGADRIVENGDTANKVGSSSLSIVAKHYGIPFYVVAPTSTFDLSLKTGDEIEIEMRPEEEVLSAMGERIAPEASRALNPSFDVTDHKLITGIICENGMVKEISPDNITKIVKG